MKRILWKRGMRLTDDLLRASDESTEEFVGRALMLAAAGRFGLIPSVRPFVLTLNITGNLVDVESLSCLAVTKGGNLIDAQYDTTFNNNFDTRLTIPADTEVKEFILTINTMPGQWKETFGGYEEPVYSFSLVAPDTIIPDNSMPIARLVDDHGWRMDDADFVPPCLFVSSHRKYEELLQRFNEILAALDTKSRASLNGAGHNAIRIFWPIVQQLRITASKECDLMTPMTLLSNVQKCVSAFTCACDLDETLELSDAKMFRGYVLAPYNYKDAYQRIKVGLQFCYSITEKVDRMATQAPPKQEPKTADQAKLAAPTIPSSKLSQECSTSETTVPIIYAVEGATVHFTTDGSTPTPRSPKASKAKKGFSVKFDNGYRKEKGKEADKTITIKLVALVDGVTSNIASYDIMLHKSLKFRNAIPI